MITPHDRSRARISNSLPVRPADCRRTR